MTCFTPGVCEAMRRAVSRAASSGRVPDRATPPSFAVTLMAADLSDGSENILALISVVMVSSVGLLLAQELARIARKSGEKIHSFDRCITPPSDNPWEAGYAEMVGRAVPVCVFRAAIG